MNLVFLIDATSTQETPEGYLRIKAYASRTGVFTYPLKSPPYDKQLRKPEEVFSTESMNTLKGKAVTIEHPRFNGQPILLDVNNTKLFSKGYVEEVYQEDNKLAVIVLITDIELKDQITTQRLTKLSAGYNAYLAIESGVYNNEPYTSVQTNITYNHLAFVKDPRGGSELSILMDSEENQQKELMMSCFDSIEDINNERGEMMAKITIDSVELEVSESVAMAVNNKLNEFKNLSANYDSIKGEKEQLEKQIDKIKSVNLDSNEIEKKVNAKLDILLKVKTIAPDVNFDSKDDIKDVMTKAIQKYDESFDSKDMSEDEIKGNLNSIVRLHAKLTDKEKSTMGKMLAGTVKSTNTDARDTKPSAYQQYVNNLTKGVN